MKWTEEHRKNHKLAFENKKGDKHWNWKGDNVGYTSLHEWVRVNFSLEDHCEKCGVENVFLEWASKEGNYTRNREDWLNLCRSCHKTYDGIVYNITKMKQFRNITRN